MSDNKKYPKGGICKFENFSQSFTDDVVSNYLYPIGGIDGWYLGFMRYRYDSKSRIMPFIKCNHHILKPKLGVRYFFKIVNNINLNSFKIEHKFCLKSNRSIYGNSRVLSEILDEKNGWLKNGTLSIEYGIHVESILENDGIWRFNFHDEIFDCGGKPKMIFMFDETNNKFLYSHLQLLTFHSPILSEKGIKIEKGLITGINLVTNQISDNLEKCLQIAHGVRLKPSRKSIFSIISIAKFFKLQNVLRYCELQLIEKKDPSMLMTNDFRPVFKYNLHRYLNQILKNVTTLEMMKQILGDSDIHEMSTECMKIMVQKLFYDFC